MIELAIMITIGIAVGALTFAALHTIQSQVDKMRRDLDSVNQMIESVLRDMDLVRNEVNRNDSKDSK